MSRSTPPRALTLVSASTVLLSAITLASLRGQAADHAFQADAPHQVADCLDALIQPRFQDDRAGVFGITRVVTPEQLAGVEGHYGLALLQPKTPTETALLHQANAARHDYVIAFLHCAHVPGHYANTHISGRSRYQAVPAPAGNTPILDGRPVPADTRCSHTAIWPLAARNHGLRRHQPPEHLCPAASSSGNVPGVHCGLLAGRHAPYRRCQKLLPRLPHGSQARRHARRHGLRGQQKAGRGRLTQCHVLPRKITSPQPPWGQRPRSWRASSRPSSPAASRTPGRNAPAPSGPSGPSSPGPGGGRVDVGPVNRVIRDLDLVALGVSRSQVSFTRPIASLLPRSTQIHCGSASQAEAQRVACCRSRRRRRRPPCRCWRTP